jgi:GNAT superfamily N-acetyltransferase
VSGGAKVRPARPDELPILATIERASAGLFEEIGMHLEASVPVAERGEAPLVALVAGQPPVGFVWLELVGGEPHVEEIAVMRSAGRRGVGRALLEAACTWARDSGYRSVTLCTFRDVPWNGPFYRSAGFVELEPDELGPELLAIRATERANGLDAFGPRLVMIRHLD